MKTMLTIMNHVLLDDQKEYVKKYFNIENFIFLPEELKDILKNVPPDKEIDSKNLNKICDFIDKNLKQGDYIVIQGEFGSTFYLVDFSLQKGFIPIHATTKRVYKEIIEKDGTVTRNHQFKFIKFRKYIKYKG